MDVVGLGTEILECGRVRQMIDRHGEAFLRRVYTDREVRECHARPKSTEQFTARFAAKHAVLRALGRAPAKRQSWTEIEIAAAPGEPPAAVLAGQAREWADSLDVRIVLVTLAHCRHYATATALALGDDT